MFHGIMAFQSSVTDNQYQYLEIFLVRKATLDGGSELLVRQPALAGGALGVLLLESRHEETLEPEH